jgi:hypothetical protein
MSIMNTTEQSVEIEFGLHLSKGIFIKVLKKLISKINSSSALKNKNTLTLGKATFKNYSVFTVYNKALASTSKKFRKVETASGITYESKERLTKEKRNNIDLFGKQIPIFIRSSIETKLEKEEFEKSTQIFSNAERILRLTIPTQYFNIDLSIRYIFENESKTDRESARKEKLVKNLTLSFNDFLEAVIVPGATILYDIEFELKDWCVEQIIAPKSVKTQESVILDSIYSMIVELLTDRNLLIEDLIKNYTRTPQVVTFSNEIIEKINSSNMVQLLKTDGVRNLMIITLFKTEFRSFLKFYRWNSIDSETIELIELDESKICNKTIKSSKNGSDLFICHSEELLGIFDCERVNLSKTQIKLSKLDAEPYDYYYIFDGYYIRSIEDAYKQAIGVLSGNKPDDKLTRGDIRTCNFEQRMKKITEWLININKFVVTEDLPDDNKVSAYSNSKLGTVVYNTISTYGTQLRIISKNYDLNVDYAKLVETYNTILEPIEDGVTTIDFDGYILQIKQPYELLMPTQHDSTNISPEKKLFDLSKTYSFKVKPLRFNTIDFKLKNDNSKIIPSYPSYTSPEGKNNINPIYDMYVVGSGQDSTYNLKEISRTKTSDKFTEILFSTPFIEGANTYDASLDSEIEWTVGKKVHPKDVDLNGKIVEMWFDQKNKQWHIHRIRHDKTKPNGYRTAFSNMSLFFDPLRMESYYSPKLVTFSEELIEYFHDCSHYVRDVIYEKLQNYMFAKRFDSLSKINYLDFAGGRGGDVSRIINLMTAMSPTAILNLFATDISSTGLVKYAQKTQKLSQTTKRVVNLNVIAEPNGDKNQSENLYKEIISRKEFAKFNVINMSFAIHYISDYLNEFVELCSKLLSNDFIIMLTFYDSEKVLENISKFKVFKDIKIDIENNEAYMPLPTISSSGYREEPCMSNEHINLLKTSFADRCEIYDFNPFFNNNLKTATRINDKNGIEDVKLYFNCVRTLIFVSEVS